MLSDEEIMYMYNEPSSDAEAIAFAREVEAAVLAKLQAQSEPVAWMTPMGNVFAKHQLTEAQKADLHPLYTHPAPVQAQSEPVQFLANGTRFKTTLLADGSVRITGLPYELAGRWVALVAAENDCHMKLTAPVQQDVNQTLLDALNKAADAIESWGSYASKYFQDKHNLQGDINKAHAAIAQVEGSDD